MRPRPVDPRYLKTDQGFLIVDSTTGKARLLETSDLPDPTVPLEAITATPAHKRFQFVTFGSPIPLPEQTLAVEFCARGGEAFVAFGSDSVAVSTLDDATSITDGTAPEFIPAKAFLVFDLRKSPHTHFALAGSGAVYVRMWGTEAGT